MERYVSCNGFQASVIVATTGALAGEQRPDLMARCTWHEHPSVLDRLRCEMASGRFQVKYVSLAHSILMDRWTDWTSQCMTSN